MHRDEADILRKVMSTFEIDFVFDVGANTGQFASRLRTDAGYTGRIVSFEPIPQLAAHIEKVSANDPLWDVQRLALSDTAGPRKFRVAKNSQFSSLNEADHSHISLFTEMNDTAAVIDIECETLASVFEKLKAQYGFKRPFLKMDTQGSDMSVVRGGLPIIDSFVAFQSELSVTPIYSNSIDFRQALYFYEGLGFYITRLFLPNRGHFPRLVDIDVIMINSRFANSI